jgi:hypothetical protein
MLQNTINDIDCECTAILLQDIGPTGPDGPVILKDVLGDHHLYVNFKSTNKSRTVAIILHKSWDVKQIYKDQNGSAIGVVAHRAGTDILFISSYLPASLNRCGFPRVWNEEDPNYPIQTEARSTYASLFEWIQTHKYWVLGRPE